MSPSHLSSAAQRAPTEFPEVPSQGAGCGALADPRPQDPGRAIRDTGGLSLRLSRTQSKAGRGGQATALRPSPEAAPGRPQVAADPGIEPALL